MYVDPSNVVRRKYATSNNEIDIKIFASEREFMKEINMPNYAIEIGSGICVLSDIKGEEIPVQIGSSSSSSRDTASYIPSKTYIGSKSGYVFKTGDKGLGEFLSQYIFTHCLAFSCSICMYPHV